MKHNQTAPLMFLASLTSISLSCRQEKPVLQPNILFIMTDDHAQQAISAYGSVLNETPNIDRLAEEGMIFRNSFVTNSISAPSRAVILTGQFSHRTGLVDNAVAFDSSLVTFPKLMQAAGYQTAMIGKWHLKSEPAGFDYWKVLPGQGHYYNPDFRTPDGPEQIEGYVTDIITDLALDWLKSGRDNGKPFLLMYQHKAPHREWFPGPGHLYLYNDVVFPEPATLFDDYHGRGRAAREQEMTLMHHMNLHGDLKIKPPELDSIKPGDPWPVNAFKWNYSRMTPGQKALWDAAYDPVQKDFENRNLKGDDLLKWKYQRYMQDYLRCIASVDDNIGRVLDYLEESGLSENTIVVYTSDQGFYLGEHGWYDKRFMYEESFRTPLIVRWPGFISPGSECHELVQNIDLPETFLDAAGIKTPEQMQGTSLLPLFRQEEDAGWKQAMYYHYYEYPAVHMVKRHYGIRTHRYKLIHFYYDVDEWELYDLENDPLELTNQVLNPAYSRRVDSLRIELENLREYYGDSDSLNQLFIDRHTGRN